MTNDIGRRVKEHNNGYNKTTKPYRPFTLIYSEEFHTRNLAREKEKFLKAGSGKKFLRNLLE